MTHKTTKAKNKTGIATNVEGAKEMRKAAAYFPPSSTGSKFAADMVRIHYARAVGPDDLGYGSVPEPLFPSAAAAAEAAGLLGKHPKLFYDKLGARMTFERIGVRLYEVLVSKHEAFGSYEGGPSRQELEDILAEEHRHFSMLEEVIVRLGGDPTAVTPSADLVANVGGGVHRVLTDPRTTLVQCLEAILVAELADRDGWALLIEVARTAEQDDLVVMFEEAQAREDQHVTRVRAWLEAAIEVS